MRVPTWIGSRRVVREGGERQVITNVTSVRRAPLEREVPIVVCVAADQRLTVEVGR